ncbi:MAG: dihydroorotase [Cyclobacteriaceae bacterium]|nr:dihydroorotase [Cyclobacteriaceae bacterium]
MRKYLIKNGAIVNEGKIFHADILIAGERIEKIAGNISPAGNCQEIDAGGKHIFPGVIDDQVHFREPGLTHKADIYTEARAAVAGGVTSFMEMPNVVPQTLTQALLADKYEIGRKRSLANYSFYMGASNDNLDEVLRTDASTVCGIKIFMGSSTGNMLVDNEAALEAIFSQTPMLIATHCEDEGTIRQNTELAKEKYGANIPFSQHPIIRSVEACYLSSSRAVALAKKHGTRLHILHISSGKETFLFDNQIPLRDKRITSEACIHHLWFSDEDYDQKGSFIKWNPAVKSAQDREQLWKALLDDRIDVIATDHAPHTLAEKNNGYLQAPSGGPLVQHSLVSMLSFYQQGKISLERIAEKMSHAVADCFHIRDRGYIREGYFADLAIVDMNRPWQVTRENILSKCGWSPFENVEFGSSVTETFVSGHLAYQKGIFNEENMGMRLTFAR